MIDILVKIKRAIISGRFAFSEKARNEMEIDSITDMDVAESIINAVAIYKTIRSRSSYKKDRREKLYIIQSTNFEGLMIYTKGKLIKQDGKEVFYFLISSKKAL